MASAWTASAGAEAGATSNGCGNNTATNVSVTLRRLIDEYDHELKETMRLRAEWASLRAQNAVLMSMLDERQRAFLEAGPRPPRPSTSPRRAGAEPECQSPDSITRSCSLQTMHPDGKEDAQALRPEGRPLTDTSVLHGVCIPDTPIPGQVLRVPKNPKSMPSSPRRASASATSGFELRGEWSRGEAAAAIEDAMRQNTCYNDRDIPRTRTTMGPSDPLPWYISHPSGRTRMLMGFAGGTLIVYDLLTIPLQVFKPGGAIFFTIMDWVTLLFWTIDMLLGPFEGYIEKGVLEMRPNKVFKHYLRSGRWAVDAVVVVPDWIFSLVSPSSSKSFRLLRVLRAVRTLRLLRLVRLNYIVAAINDMTDSEYVSILVGICKMLLFLMLINHLLACAWYATGTLLAPAGAETWVGFHEFDRHTWAYCYATSFHWAITQFTPSSMHVQPQNLTERLFAIAVVVFALIGFSYIVGSISTSLSKLRGMKEENAHQFWQLKRFLKQNDVPQKLRYRVMRYGEYAVQMQKDRVHIENNKIYKLISEQLQNELACAVAAPFLCVHPLFHHLQFLKGSTMHRLAYSAVSFLHIGRVETVFHRGEMGNYMYFAVEGVLQYRSKKRGIERVDSQEYWISEPVLWASAWKHLGDLMAVEDCTLLRVDPAALCQTVRMNPAVFNQVRSYASLFISWLNQQEIDTLSDIGQGEEITAELRTFIQHEDP